MTNRLVLALDFGGTKLAAGLLDLGTRSWLARGRCATPFTEDAEVVLAEMLALADGLLDRARRRPDAVGTSFNGPVDVASGCPRTCYHIAGWEGLALRERVAAHYGAATAMDNDATAAALGEWQYGAGRGYQDLLYVTVSTGVGGGLILGGKLYRGSDGMAGEIGHMCLDPDGPLCACGRRGCLEALAAGPAIVRYMEDLLATSSTSEECSHDGQRLTARAISIAAAGGDELARQALRQAAGFLGIAIGNLLNVLNLQRVILGGGVTESGAEYWGWVRGAAAEVAIDGVGVDIVPAQLGADAPLWGACALAEDLDSPGAALQS